MWYRSEGKKKVIHSPATNLVYMAQKKFFFSHIGHQH